MKLRCNPRDLLCAATAATVFTSLTTLPAAQAQTSAFPIRPITIVAPTAPGSTTDLISRLLTPALQRTLGVPVIVENKVGAASAIGASAVAQAAPDGHTLLMAPPPVLSINQWLYRKLTYNPDKDFTPVIAVAATPNILVVHPSVSAQTLVELIALAKARPGQLTFASGGSGTTHHLCGELLKLSAGVSLTHVPYKSPAPALQDVIAGRVQLMCDNLSNAIPFLKTGQLRAIALTAKKRHPLAPDVPTTLEAGLPELEVGVWFGVVAPTGTPRPVIERLNAEITKALREPALIERFESIGLAILADTPESFGRLIVAESAKWRRVIELTGAQVD